MGIIGQNGNNGEHYKDEKTNIIDKLKNYTLKSRDGKVLKVSEVLKNYKEDDDITKTY